MREEKKLLSSLFLIYDMKRYGGLSIIGWYFILILVLLLAVLIS